MININLIIINLNKKINLLKYKYIWKIIEKIPKQLSLIVNLQK